jgi:hypothetical protein
VEDKTRLADALRTPELKQCVALVTDSGGGAIASSPKERKLRAETVVSLCSLSGLRHAGQAAEQSEVPSRRVHNL